MKLFYCYWVILLVLASTACRKQPVQTADIEITPSVIHVANDKKYTKQITATIKNSSTVVNITWTSANTSIANVNQQGFIAGLAPGTTEITATVSNGGASAKVKVVVYDTLDYKYRLVLKNRGPVQHSLNNPSAYLSARAIARRNKMNIAIDSSDIPISAQYLSQIENAGGKIVAKSKWLKTVSVQCHDAATLDKLKTLPFVLEGELVWTGKKDTAAFFRKEIATTAFTHPRSVHTPEIYGDAWFNISIVKGQFLHNAGYKGNGIQIAVLDAGFTNLKNNPALNNINILGAKSFVQEKHDPYATGNHGVYVTSCMATNRPGTYIGTAPEAGYWLFMTEDESSEYPIEEDYWVAALEYADSAGVDVVNTSLGYDEYDPPARSHVYGDLDGKTTQAAKGAKFGAAKGMVLVVSAGNESRFVGTPADSPDVLSVGAIDRNLSIAAFSSYGMTVDGRIKPDVVALGARTAVIDLAGNSVQGSGTSFAGPVMCGLAACLWQAYPKLSNREVITTIIQSSNHYTVPLLPYGYGIPDMEKAMQIAAILNAGR